MAVPREQEDSIKDRKKLLFDNDDPPFIATGDRKPFALYLKETPPQPISGLVKAMLWAVGIAVGVLLMGAMWKASQPKVKTKVSLNHYGVQSSAQLAIHGVSIRNGPGSFVFQTML